MSNKYGIAAHTFVINFGHWQLGVLIKSRYIILQHKEPFKDHPNLQLSSFTKNAQTFVSKKHYRKSDEQQIFYLTQTRIIYLLEAQDLMNEQQQHTREHEERGAVCFCQG